MQNAPNEPLERQLIKIMGSNREGSYASQRKRSYELHAAARTLKERFGLQKWANLKAKHVRHLVDQWKAEDQGRRTVEQKLSHFRWVLGKIGKPNLLSRTNAELGIQPGPRHTRAGKVFPEEKLKAVLGALDNSRIRGMLLLARYLGLRFEEAALFRPGRDWQGNRVWIKRGTKGGRPRHLNLHNDRQVSALKTARAATSKEGALIPAEARTFEEWRQRVYRNLRALGISRQEGTTFHDLRRTYAIERMKYLADRKGMGHHWAAQLVAREMGHHRTEVLDWYLAACSGPAVI